MFDMPLSTPILSVTDSYGIILVRFLENRLFMFVGEGLYVHWYLSFELKKFLYTSLILIKLMPSMKRIYHGYEYLQKTQVIRRSFLPVNIPILFGYDKYFFSRELTIPQKMLWNSFKAFTVLQIIVLTHTVICNTVNAFETATHFLGGIVKCREKNFVCNFSFGKITL